MLSSNLIEQVRQDLGLTVRDFCSRLTIAMDDYVAFISADNLRNFPPRAVSQLREIMLGMERANLEKFRAHLVDRAASPFQSAKIMRHLDKLTQLQGPHPEQAGPITVEFHLTNLCNHRCPACTFGIPEAHIRHAKADGEQPWRKMFDTDLLEPMLEDFTALGVRGIVLSGGGEPLLHKDAAHVMRRIKAHGFELGLVTNGSLLHGEGGAAADLRAAILETCVWCRISVDAGSQEIYEQMHGRGSAVRFDQLIAGITQLAQEKQAAGASCTIGTSYLLTPWNYTDLLPAVCVFRDIDGVDYFQVKPAEVPPMDRGMRLDNIFWDRRIFDTLIMIGAYQHDRFAVYTLSFKFADMLLSETDGLPFSRCWGHPFYPTVCADGSVIICCHMLEYVFRGSPVGVYGRISAEHRFRDLWLTRDRYAVGAGIAIRMCPSNCKLSEANKTLEQIVNASPHANFIS